MRPVIQTDAKSNLVGSLWMIGAMASFAAEDMFLKIAAGSLPIGQVMVLFGIGGMLVFALSARWKNETIFNPAILSLPMIVRAGFEIAGRLFYTLAIALAPLSSATAILQATPLVVVGGAAVFFGETVGWRRWSAIILGLIGVLIILQPGTESFTVYSIFAVLGMLGFAGRDLATRTAPKSLTTSVLGVYGFLAITVAGICFGLWQGTAFVALSANVAMVMIGGILFGALGYSSLMIAMRTGEVSAVTPFRYSRLLFGLALGVLWFGETLTPATLFGCGLVVLAGLFILSRNKSA